MFYCQIHNHYSFTQLCPICFPVATASTSTDIELHTPLTEFIEKEAEKYCKVNYAKATEQTKGDAAHIQDVSYYSFVSGANLMLPIIEEKEREIERLFQAKLKCNDKAMEDAAQIQSLTEERDKWKEQYEQLKNK